MSDTLAHLLVVLAQAGGGGSFGGSSGGGGGGGFSGGGSSFGGGGGGGGELSPEAVVIMLILWGVVTLVGKYGQKQQRQRVTRTIRQGRKVQEEMLRQQALAGILTRDPGFNEGQFLQQASQAFVTTQYAWSDQDLTSCRPFISDGVHERFDLYIGMQKVEGIRNRMKDVSVTGAQVVAITTDTHYDTIHVRFTARAISYNESLTSGRRVSGNSDTVPITFTEIWSFSRRPGVQTRQGASLLQGSCPNCGEILHIADRAQCTACQAIVNSGEHDWVLSEITQDEEWIVPPASHKVPGWEVLSQRDPGLNYQHLEDRASVVYWRSMMAVYHQDLGYAAPVLPPGVTDVPPLWATQGDAYWHTPAVGSVEVQRVIPGTAEDPVDRVHVQVRWSATRADGDRRKPQLRGTQRIYTHVLILRRNAGVTSNLAHTFTSFSCQNCGGPLDVGKATECKFCATPINDGSKDWVLEDVQPFAAIRALLREQAADSRITAAGGVERMETDRLTNEPELLVAVARMAMADGVLHDKEAQLLAQIGQSRGVTHQRMAGILEAVADPSYTVPMPKGEEQAQAFMLQLIRAALIDGMISKEEQRFLVGIATPLGWTARDLNRSIKHERSRLYQEAKQVIRQADHMPPPPPPQAPPTDPNRPPPQAPSPPAPPHGV